MKEKCSHYMLHRYFSALFSVACWALKFSLLIPNACTTAQNKKLNQYIPASCLPILSPLFFLVSLLAAWMVENSQIQTISFHQNRNFRAYERCEKCQSFSLIFNSLIYCMKLPSSFPFSLSLSLQLKSARAFLLCIFILDEPKRNKIK